VYVPLLTREEAESDAQFRELFETLRACSLVDAAWAVQGGNAMNLRVLHQLVQRHGEDDAGVREAFWEHADELLASALTEYRKFNGKYEENAKIMSILDAFATSDEVQIMQVDLPAVNKVFREGKESFVPTSPAMRLVLRNSGKILRSLAELEALVKQLDG
jgi:hypothetical protein